MEKILKELAKALIPDALFPVKHTGLAFISFVAAIALYGKLMLDEDEVENWKQGLLYTVIWILVSALGLVLATGEFEKINAGEEHSRFFISGMLLLSIAYIVISILAWWVRYHWLARILSVLVVLGRLVDCFWFVSILI